MNCKKNVNQQELAIYINGLCKTYRNGIHALQDASLSVPQGSFYALLGPNGAGKSTLINILTSLVHKTSGTVQVLGSNADTDMNTIKSHLGLMPQEINLGVFEQVEHILLNQAGYYGIPQRVAAKRMNGLLEKLNLTDKRHDIVRNLSGGMKRRVMVARALIHDPEIVILDEPSAGVDIELRRNMWDFFIELNKAGKTIILTTHYLEEAEQLCDHVAIINHGRVITESGMPSLLRKLDHESFILYLSQPTTTKIELPGCHIRNIDATTLEVKTRQDFDIGQVIRVIEQQGARVQSMRNKSNRLESIFLELTQTPDETN